MLLPGVHLYSGSGGEGQARESRRTTEGKQRDLLAEKALALLYYYEDRLPVLEEPSAGQSHPIFYITSALGDDIKGRFEVRIADGWPLPWQAPNADVSQE